MTDTVIGVLHKDTISLETPVPRLEGKRVRLTIEPIAEDPERVLSPEEADRLWREWAERGPQGPIESDRDWPVEL